jgi:hypothetical protein
MLTYNYLKKKRQEKKQGSAPAAQHSSEKPKSPSCPHRTAAETNTTKCEVCVQEKKAASRYRWKLLLLLLPGFFTSSLDLTVVATALPFIASHFGEHLPPTNLCPQLLTYRR